MEEKKEEPKPAKPVPKQMTAEAPPDLTKPTPPDVKDLEKPKEPPKEIEALKKEELKKPDKPKEKPKPPAPKPKVVEKKQDDDFQSLLKKPDARCPFRWNRSTGKAHAGAPDIASLRNWLTA
ncbi:MAG: hypothetical protein LRY39_01925 [Alphaproteobacteria bacterium]|nr:hypothetical protein [Alphaproteobacteria bacterium]